MLSMKDRSRACVRGAMKSLGCASTQSSSVPQRLRCQGARSHGHAPHVRVATEQRFDLEAGADVLVALDELGQDVARPGETSIDDQEHGHERLVCRHQLVHRLRSTHHWP